MLIAFLWKATSLRCMEGYSTYKRQLSKVRLYKFKSGGTKDTSASSVRNTPRVVRGIPPRDLEMLRIEMRSGHH